MTALFLPGTGGGYVTALFIGDNGRCFLQIACNACGEEWALAYDEHDSTPLSEFVHVLYALRDKIAAHRCGEDK